MKKMTPEELAKYVKKRRLIVKYSLWGILLLIVLSTIFNIGEDITYNGNDRPTYNFPVDTTIMFKDYQEKNGELKNGEINQPPSYECLGCHDGSIASDKGHWASGQINNHPIGVLYPTFNSEMHSSNSPSGLGGTIEEDLLEGGFVGCTSCHNKHSEEDGKTSIKKNNKGSELCLTCHNL